MVPPLINRLTTCIVGGGSSAHVLIPFLSEAGHHVHLLTRRPEDWHDVVYCQMTDGHTGEVATMHAGKLHRKSLDPADVIPQADIIILCMPVHQYRHALDRLAEYINRDKEEVFVGAIYGQAGVNWMVHAMEREHRFTNIVTFACGSIPWICRTLEYGKTVANYGGKVANLAAVSPPEKFQKLDEILLQDMSLRPLRTGAFHQACSFLSLTMSVDNQIIHPARCYGLWQHENHGTWASESDVPFFYRDFDQQSASNIRLLDRDYSAIRAAIRKHFPKRAFTFMLSYLDLENFNHESNHVDILASIKESKQLASIMTPTVAGHHGTRVLNVDCRFFTDDIGYGLLIAKWVAEKLNVKTPFIDEVITWAQTLKGEEFLDEHGKINTKYCLKEKFTSGIPESYGITSVDDILD